MRSKIIALSFALVAVIVVFLLFGLTGNWEYVLERRAYKLGALILVSCSIAYSSLVFQTLTHNRILTPSIMGFESVYLLFQSLIVFWYGDKTFQVLTESNNFFVSVFMMTGFAGLLYVLIFRKEKNNMYLLLLTGLILGTLFNTLSSFVQMLIDPNEFSMIEAKIFASFNQMNIRLFWFAVGAAVLAAVLAIRNNKFLDVIALGRENAINLGIDYNRIILIFLLIISVLVSVSTALVGPIMFFGILVTNLTYELFKTHRHSVLILACCLISSITLIIGQFAVEHLFNLNTTISILINFVGGVYFLYVLLKAKKI